MKLAHKYNLKVIFTKKPSWDIDVLATSTEAVTMWLNSINETEEDYITFVAISLIEYEFREVKPEFLAQGL